MLPAGPEFGLGVSEQINHGDGKLGGPRSQAARLTSWGYVCRIASGAISHAIPSSGVRRPLWTSSTTCSSIAALSHAGRGAASRRSRRCFRDRQETSCVFASRRRPSSGSPQPSQRRISLLVESLNNAATSSRSREREEGRDYRREGVRRREGVPWQAGHVRADRSGQRVKHLVGRG
jgi:hypothetical protein